MQEVKHFYRKIKPDFEYCFNIETSAPLMDDEIKILRWLLVETYEIKNLKEKSFLEPDKDITEIGPRLSFETAYSTNAVSIFHACGLKKVTRVECSRRYLVPPDIDKELHIIENHDRMTECPYPEPLHSFTTGTIPEEVYHVNIMAGGINELIRFNRENGLGMDEWDIEFYLNMFTQVLRRNPTNVELFMLGNNNSEHSRHWYFKGKLIIDGQEAPDTLFQIVKSTFLEHPVNSVIAFSDNSSAIKGYEVWSII
ncbi:phosphoribosylformylglycinamidine synthase, partial [Chloroflexota bacterium]